MTPLDPDAQRREERLQAELARAEREQGGDGFAALMEGWQGLIGPPVMAFVIGGMILVLLPPAPTPTATAIEMITLLGLIYTLAMSGGTRALGNPEASVKWRWAAVGVGVLGVVLGAVMRMA